MIRPLPAGYNSGDTIYCFFSSYAGSTGASVTISGLAVTDVEIYKNGSTTQRASDNGYSLLDTDGIDFDGSTGLHGLAIDTSDNSDSGFWSDGSHYLIWIDAITVDSQTVRLGFEFRLGVLLRPTTSGRKLDVTATGTAGIDWGNLENESATVTLDGTTLGAVTSVETVADATVSAIQSNAITAAAIAASALNGKGDWNIGKTGYTISGTIQTLDALDTAQDSQHANTQAELAKVPKSDGSVGWNATALGQINTQADTALSDVGVTTTITGRIDVAISTRLATAGYTAPLDATGTRTAIGMASANLDTQLANIITLANDIPTNAEMVNVLIVGARFPGMVELDGSVYRYTANALEQGPSGGGGGGSATLENQELILTAIGQIDPAAEPVAGQQDTTATDSLAVFIGDDHTIDSPRDAFRWAINPAIDLTGATGKLKVWIDGSATNLIDEDLTFDNLGAAEQGAYAEVDATASGLLRVGKFYQFEAALTLSGGVKWTAASGSFAPRRKRRST